MPEAGRREGELGPGRLLQEDAGQRDLPDAGADEVVENFAGYDVPRLLERLKLRTEG